jgi:hypothetical protein
MDQHADARELAALYISAGVPIYPYSLGHSYHTLNWRMGIETKDMQEKAEAAAAANPPEQTDEDDDDAPAPIPSPVDRFYSDRSTGFRARDGNTPAGTYLEEKCAYWLGPTNGASSPLSGRWSSMVSLHQPPREHPAVPPGADPLAQPPALGAAAPRMPAFRPFGASNPSPPLSNSSSPSRSLSHSDLQSLNGSKAPKVLVQVHRHLLDQHLLGRPCVDDEDGAMNAPPVSLTADFFHPHLSANNLFGKSKPTTSQLSSPDRNNPAVNNVSPDEGLLEDPAFQAWAARAAATVQNRLGGAALEDAEDLAELQELYTQIFSVDRIAAPAGDVDTPTQNAAAAVPPPPPPVLPQPPGSPQNSLASSLEESLLSRVLPRSTQNSVLNLVDLEVYSASTANFKGKEGAGDLRRHLKTRFTFYQRRLEVLLLHGDSFGYEECMLDFWDEFLPLTANIHYYDRHTAVPRLSNLQKFLTSPCPKAIGIVQCEIERIKISSKKRKGVSMKGRLFPTYEYRLFIRDREHGKSIGNSADEAPEAEEDSGIRRDTVLMVAKNRGRKHVDTSGVVSLTPASKKGANNYYLYTPQQVDVDTHFNNVNETKEEVSGKSNGVSLSTPPPVECPSPMLLGRLQSNFIGTEFQIYTPRLRKNLPGKNLRRCASLSDSPPSYDEDLEYESGAASDTGASTSRRRSRFGRLTLRRSSSHTAGTNERTLPLESPSSSRARNRQRQEGSGGRAPRVSRRAIANSVESSPFDEPESLNDHHPVLCEEEDGVITYTANLLGSRPRIMDVCIPKVSQDGTAGSVWRRYLENSDEADDCASYNRMLNCFKQLQQRLESHNSNGNDGDQNNEQAPGQPEDFGLLALQNRPPWWNIELGSFVLNFRGRVSVASVKNFQLCDRNDHDHIMLQFGRIQGRHSFTMDYQYPLTAVQAFSIAISSLQSKISFG